MINNLVAVIDVGTTNLKVVIFDDKLNLIDQLAHPLSKKHPQPTWTEQSPIEIYSAAEKLLGEAMSQYPSITILGITNQRESVVAWDCDSGEPLYPVIVWEDKRTQDMIDEIVADKSFADYIRQTTGLIPSPYFSATKIMWLIRQFNAKNNIAIGTIDSWLLYKLTGEHRTDYTNASRTMLFDIHRLCWDSKLLEKLEIPESLLPEVFPSKTDFGIAKKFNLPIKAIIGDQQASLYAAGDETGTVKVTYGTGVFIMKALGDEFLLDPDFLTTLSVSSSIHPQYAFEAKIDNGSARTTPVIGKPKELAKVVTDIATETAKPLMKVAQSGTTVYVDGGISQNDVLLRKQRELNHVHIQRLSTYEGTALGVAKLLIQG